MKLNIYSMFDRVEGAHRMLVTARSDASAARSFCDEMIRYKKSMEGKSAVDLADFELHRLGSYDDETGIIDPLLRPMVVPLSYGSSEDSVASS